MPKFKLMNGKHVAGSGTESKIYKATKTKKPIIETNDPLDKMWPDRFQRVSNNTPASQPISVVPKVKEPVKEEDVPEDLSDDIVEAPDSSDDDDKGLSEALGEDVTSQFKKAQKADLKVFQKGKNFSVADADEPTKPLEGAESLKDKKSVAKFINDYLNGD